MKYLLLFMPAVVATLALLLAPRARASDVLVGFALTFYSVLALPLAPIVALFRGEILRTDTIVVSAGENGYMPVSVDRYALPKWLSWFQTPDEPMPGGLYEQAVVDAYLAGGRWWCATTWLWRNSLFGAAWAHARPASHYIDTAEGLVEGADGLWRWQGTYGPIKVETGRKVYRADFNAHAVDGPLVSVPFFTVRMTKQN